MIRFCILLIPALAAGLFYGTRNANANNNATSSRAAFEAARRGKAAQGQEVHLGVTFSKLDDGTRSFGVEGDNSGVKADPLQAVPDKQRLAVYFESTKPGFLYIYAQQVSASGTISSAKLAYPPPGQHASIAAATAQRFPSGTVAFVAQRDRADQIGEKVCFLQSSEPLEISKVIPSSMVIGWERDSQESGLTIAAETIGERSFEVDGEAMKSNDAPPTELHRVESKAGSRTWQACSFLRYHSKS